MKIVFLAITIIFLFIFKERSDGFNYYLRPLLTLFWGGWISFLTSYVVDVRRRAEYFYQKSNQMENVMVKMAEINDNTLVFIKQIEQQIENEERKRITRELHDSIGYALTNITVLAGAVLTVLPTDVKKTGELIKKIREQSRQCYDESRAIIYKLRYQKKIKPPLSKLLFSLCSDFNTVTKIPVKCYLDAIPKELYDLAYSTLYRATQTVLMNAIHHVGVKAIRFMAQKDEKNLSIDILNQGVYLDEKNTQDGIGISGIKERVEALNGSFTIKNSVDGFQIIINLPLRKKEKKYDKFIDR